MQTASAHAVPGTSSDTIDTLTDLLDGPILAGPLLRRVEPTRLVLWLAAIRPLDLRLALYPSAEAPRSLCLADEVECLPLGRYAHVHLIDVRLDAPLPRDTLIGYDLRIATADGERGIA
ncbi:MAG: alkaline phosphatase family protein, partial [Halomonas sp.]|nr:alkaline phosphatase family protein [Halomonas sp.]